MSWDDLGEFVQSRVALNIHVRESHQNDISSRWNINAPGPVSTIFLFHCIIAYNICIVVFIIYLYIDCKSTLFFWLKNQMNLQVSQRWSAGVTHPASHPCIIVSKYIHSHILYVWSTSIVYMHPSIHLPTAPPEDFLRCCNQSMCVGLGTSAGRGTSVGRWGENGMIVLQFLNFLRVLTFLATWKVYTRCMQGAGDECDGCTLCGLLERQVLLKTDWCQVVSWHLVLLSGHCSTFRLGRCLAPCPRLAWHFMCCLGLS